MSNSSERGSSQSDSAPFIHPSALCESDNIGTKTRIWAFAHVLPGAVIGTDCNICDHVFIENDVIVGDRVTVKCGVQLWDGLRIEQDVFIGPNVTFTNDKFPRSKQHLATYPRTVVERGASLGANATILPGITIGQHAMIGAGAVVTKSVPPNAIVRGNPAIIVGYVDSPQSARAALAAPNLGDSSAHSPALSPATPYHSRAKGVTLSSLPLINDLRGDLSAGEFERSVPFRPLRYFLVFGVPNSKVRGEHAHRTCHQFLIAVKGSLSVVVDDGTHREEFHLDKPNLGLHIPPMVWATQYRYSADAVLLVFASHYYAADDYIRDYNQFLSAVQV